MLHHADTRVIHTSNRHILHNVLYCIRTFHAEKRTENAAHACAAPHGLHGPPTHIARCAWDALGPYGTVVRDVKATWASVSNTLADVSALSTLVPADPSRHSLDDLSHFVTLMRRATKLEHSRRLAWRC